MLNNHHRRIFTVAPAGQQTADFATLSAALAAVSAASAANGTWSATNRALIIVYGTIVEPAQFNAVAFIDVHFAPGGSLTFNNIDNAIIFNGPIDTKWSGANTGNAHILHTGNGGVNGQNTLILVNCTPLTVISGLHLNMSNGTGVATSANIATAGVSTLTLDRCILKNSAGTALLGCNICPQSNSLAITLNGCTLESGGWNILPNTFTPPTAVTVVANASRFTQNGTFVGCNTCPPGATQNITYVAGAVVSLTLTDCVLSRNGTVNAGNIGGGAAGNLTVNASNCSFIGSTNNANEINIQANPAVFQVAGSEFVNCTFINSTGVSCFAANAAIAGIKAHNNVFVGVPTAGGPITFAAQSLNGSNTLV